MVDDENSRHEFKIDTNIQYDFITLTFTTYKHKYI